MISRAYIPVLYVFNKIDSITIEELDILDQLPNYVPISSQHQWNLEELMEEIWNRCNMLRIYTKPKGQIPDYGTWYGVGLSQGTILLAFVPQPPTLSIHYYYYYCRRRRTGHFARGKSHH